MEDSVKNITALLEQAQVDKGAKDQLFRAVWQRLHAIASDKMWNEQVDHTLKVKALVYDAFVRLMADGKPCVWQNREQFFVACAESMRRILTEHDRNRRDGGKVRSDGAAEVTDRTTGDPVNMLALDVALNRMKENHRDALTVFLLRYFGQWTPLEIAEQILEIPFPRVRLLWAEAQIFLRKELGERPDDQ